MNKENIWKYKEKEKLEKQAMLRELALDISKKFWLETKKTELLIKKETLNSIEDLKKEIKELNDKNLNSIKEKELEKLFFTLKWALEVIENISKLEIKVLKDELEKNVNIEDFKNHIEDFLPKNLVNKAKNPKLVHEHILAVALGSANTLLTTAEALYKIWIWIIKSPYDLYLIISKKAEIDSFKNI